ncbi:hypothetical protein DFP72DRAFT_851454 [Ephemerocybe angulata]|uniref:MHC class I-like antigen recognition-like domain-containing protein n=1 Tax=Ephemerocybe angulata TaxID=980116 RepID=A0A8H6HQP1_9AGAR|nr:hypothetical protein DFP72DRAFT_851454 [Tulosesus angulatus]
MPSQPIFWNDKAASYAGLRAAVEVRFADGSSQSFYTGKDQSWVAPELFGEGWEQPDHDDREWKAAKILEGKFKTAVCSLLSPSPRHTVEWKGTSTISQEATSSPGSSRVQPGHLDISKAQITGAIIGAVIVAAIISAFVTFLFTKRKFQKVAT